MGWLMLYMTQAVYYSITAGFPRLQDQMVAHQILALGNSILVVPFIFGIDYLADHARKGSVVLVAAFAEVHTSEKALRHLSSAFGLFVGLSWEITFDIAVESIAHSIEHESEVSNGFLYRNFSGSFASVLIRGVLVALIAVLVIPAWRKYIFKKAHRLTE